MWFHVNERTPEGENVLDETKMTNGIVRGVRATLRRRY